MTAITLEVGSFWAVAYGMFMLMSPLWLLIVLGWISEIPDRRRARAARTVRQLPVRTSVQSAFSPREPEFPRVTDRRLWGSRMGVSPACVRNMQVRHGAETRRYDSTTSATEPVSPLFHKGFPPEPMWKSAVSPRDVESVRGRSPRRPR